MFLLSCIGNGHPLLRHHYSTDAKQFECLQPLLFTVQRNTADVQFPHDWKKTQFHFTLQIAYSRLYWIKRSQRSFSVFIPFTRRMFLPHALRSAKWGIHWQTGTETIQRACCDRCSWSFPDLTKKVSSNNRRNTETALLEHPCGQVASSNTTQHMQKSNVHWTHPSNFNPLSVFTPTKVDVFI